MRNVEACPELHALQYLQCTAKRTCILPAPSFLGSSGWLSFLFLFLSFFLSLQESRPLPLRSSDLGATQAFQLLDDLAAPCLDMLGPAASASAAASKFNTQDGGQHGSQDIAGQAGRGSPTAHMAYAPHAPWLAEADGSARHPGASASMHEPSGSASRPPREWLVAALCMQRADGCGGIAFTSPAASSAPSGARMAVLPDAQGATGSSTPLQVQEDLSASSRDLFDALFAASSSIAGPSGAAGSRAPPQPHARLTAAEASTLWINASNVMRVLPGSSFSGRGGSLLLIAGTNQSFSTDMIKRLAKPHRESFLEEAAAATDSNADRLQVLPVLLGSGAGSVVQLGAWRGMPVAVKTWDAGSSQDPGAGAKQRLLQDAALALTMNHPHVVATLHCEAHATRNGMPAGGPSHAAGDASSSSASGRAGNAAPSRGEREPITHGMGGAADVPGSRGLEHGQHGGGGGGAAHAGGWQLVLVQVCQRLQTFLLDGAAQRNVAMQRACGTDTLPACLCVQHVVPQSVQPGPCTVCSTLCNGMCRSCVVWAAWQGCWPAGRSRTHTRRAAAGARWC